METKKRRKIQLIYDRSCPACRTYCERIRVNREIGELRLIDARESGNVLNEMSEAGLDINQGLIVKLGDEVYQGSDAVHVLALISSRSGVFGLINYYVFRSAILSKVLYPILKCIRTTILAVSGKQKLITREACGEHTSS